MLVGARVVALLFRPGAMGSIVLAQSLKELVLRNVVAFIARGRIHGLNDVLLRGARFGDVVASAAGQ